MRAPGVRGGWRGCLFHRLKHFKLQISARLELSSFTRTGKLGKLGKWLGNQRTKKKSNKPLTVLGQEREAQLQELVDQGLLLWDASQRKGPRNEDDKRPFDAAWKRHFAALLKYKDQHGHW